MILVQPGIPPTALLKIPGIVGKTWFSVANTSFFSGGSRINEPLVNFDWGVSPFRGESDHFWREHPPNNGTGLLILGQQYWSRVVWVQTCSQMQLVGLAGNLLTHNSSSIC